MNLLSGIITFLLLFVATWSVLLPFFRRKSLLIEVGAEQGEIDQQLQQEAYAETLEELQAARASDLLSESEYELARKDLLQEAASQAAKDRGGV